MVYIRIKCPDRGEITKFVLRAKRGSFTHKGNDYIIDPNMIYKTKVLGLFNVYTLDYIQGQSEPLDYFSTTTELEDKLTSMYTPKTVATMLRRLFRYPNFEEIVFALIIIAIIVSGISAFLSWNTGEQMKQLVYGALSNVSSVG